MAHAFFTCRDCGLFWGFGSYEGECPKQRCSRCGSARVLQEGWWEKWIVALIFALMSGVAIYKEFLK